MGATMISKRYRELLWTVALVVFFLLVIGLLWWYDWRFGGALS